MNIDPVINSALTVLNGSMLLCLVIVITLGRKRLSKRRKAGPALTLLTEPRQCLAFFRHLAASPSLRVSASSAPFNLPPLTKEDRL